MFEITAGVLDAPADFDALASFAAMRAESANALLAESAMSAASASLFALGAWGTSRHATKANDTMSHDKARRMKPPRCGPRRPSRYTLKTTEVVVRQCIRNYIWNIG